MNIKLETFSSDFTNFLEGLRAKRRHDTEKESLHKVAHCVKAIDWITFNKLNGLQDMLKDVQRKYVLKKNEETILKGQ